MTGVNWGAVQGGGFQNALAMGMQMGAQARQAQDRRDQRNALAAYAQDPSDANFATLAQNAPQFAIQERQRMEARQQAQRQQHREQMGTVRQLLREAGQDPQRAFAAAQQLDIDLSGVPQPGSPEFEPWRQQQLFILDAIESEGDNLPGLAREVMLALPEGQRDPNSPAFRTAFTAALENKYAAEYTDAQGNTRRRAIIGQSQPALLPRDQRPAGKTDQQLFDEARAAVEAGANVDDVFRQLREWGVEVN